MEDNLPAIVSFNDRIDDTESESEVEREFFKTLKKSIRVQFPVQVKSVSADKRYCSLEILAKEIDNNGVIRNYPILPNIPIQYPETGLAYIYLPVQVGDTGVVEFFDSDIAQYLKQNVVQYHYDEEYHSLSSGIYTSGFYSDKNLFTIPDTTAAILLGTKTGTFTLKIGTDGTLTISADTTINITCPVTNITGDVIISGTITALNASINGKSVDGHVHTGVTNGESSTNAF